MNGKSKRAGAAYDEGRLEMHQYMSGRLGRKLGLIAAVAALAALTGASTASAHRPATCYIDGSASATDVILYFNGSARLAPLHVVGTTDVLVLFKVVDSNGVVIIDRTAGLDRSALSGSLTTCTFAAPSGFTYYLTGILTPASSPGF